MRIAKYIANAGYCSRREAEKLITSVRNPEPLHRPRAVPHRSSRMVQGRPRKTRKPRGLRRRGLLGEVHRPVSRASLQHGGRQDDLRREET